MPLELLSLSRRFGKTPALDEVTATLPAGATAVVGPAGAGKSTLLATIASVAAPSSGTILLDGLDLRKQRAEVRRRIGYVPPEPEPYPHLQVGEVLDYVGLLNQLDHDPARRLRVERTLERFELTGLRQRTMSSLTAGQRRRVSLACACLGLPAVLLVDDPCRGCTPEEGFQILALLADLSREATVLFATASLAEASGIAASLLVLNRGRVHYQGTPGEAVARVAGRAWWVEVPWGERRPILEGFLQTGLARGETGLWLRGLAPEQPTPTAREAQINLEDAYVWILAKGSSAGAAPNAAPAAA